MFVSLSFVLILGVVAWSTYQALAREATTATENRLDAMIKEIELPLVEVEIATGAAARIIQDMPVNDEFLYRVTYVSVEESDKVVGCAVAYADGVHNGDHWYAPYSYRDTATGEVVSKQLGHQGYDYHTMEWFRVPYETGKPHWSSPYFDKDGGEYTMTTYSYPVKNEQGEVIAVVTADVAIDWIDSLVHSIRPYPNSVSSILCSDESVIGIDDPAIIESIRESGGNNKRLQELHREMKKGGDSLISFRAGGFWNFAVYGPLRMGWSACIVCRYVDVLEPANSMLSLLLIIGIIGLLLLAVICHVTVRHLTKPITELSEAALHMSQGNFKATLPVISTGDEMMQLRDSFETMQHSLTEYIEELKTTTAANNRMEGELSVARDIQLGMLSTNFPPCLHALLVPAKEVGGDLYDFVIRPDGIIYFAVGDVSGKGAPAALLMSIARAALRFTAGMDFTLDQLMARVNNSIADANSNEMFVTLFVGRLDTRTGELQYCNGGHNPIIIIPPDADAYYLKAKANLALGVWADYRYEDERIQLQSGTRLVLYTDGVNEAEKAVAAAGETTIEQFGNDRLLQWAGGSVAKHQESTEQAVVESLYDAVQEFVQETPQNDDITILSVQYTQQQ